MRTLFEQSLLAGIGILSMTHEKAQKDRGRPDPSR